VRGALHQRLAEGLKGAEAALQLDRFFGVPAPDALLELVEKQGLFLGQRRPFGCRPAR
jgi:hypothetical protein